MRFPIAVLLFCGFATSQTTPNAAVIPADRLNEGWWARKHAAILEQIQADPDPGLLLIGDSITQNYEKSRPPDENFHPIWRQFYDNRKALNLGFSGDTTSHVLWRLEHGEVDGIHPRAAVLLIGTNNTGHGQTAVQAGLGIDAVIDTLLQKLPQTPLLLVGLLPSAVSGRKTLADREINRYLSDRYAMHARVTYLDIGPVFFRAGKLNESIFYDPRLPRPGKPLHPDTVGQRLMAEAIEPTLTRLLGDSSRQYLAGLRDLNTALIPVAKLEPDSYDWYARHRDVLAAKKQGDNPQVVLIGDSITHFWGGLPKAHIVNGPEAWKLAFDGVSVLNLGFGWDRTQNVLWRLEHGEFDGLHPKTVVIQIGTNNLTATGNARANTPEEVAEGILAIHRAVRTLSPSSRIVVMGIFPRGFSPVNAYRERIAQVNRLVAEWVAKEPNTTFLDIGSQMLQPDGTLTREVMQDGVHPTDRGYMVWARALVATGVRD